MYPNVVIAGAPRCGTTSLFEWLTAHPDVCGSVVKEAGFFLDPGDPDFNRESNYHDYGLDGYQRYFAGCRERQAKLVVEATPDYLYQEIAPVGLSSLDPLPHVILLLRKPSERSYSHFRFLRDNLALLDRRLTFREFVNRLETDENSVPAQGHARQIISNSRYGNYLGEWQRRWPKSRLHILLFEDLANDAPAFTRELALTLGIHTSFYDTYDFPIKNATVAVRNRRLHVARRRFEQRIMTHDLAVRIGIAAVLCDAYKSVADEGVAAALGSSSHAFPRFRQSLLRWTELGWKAARRVYGPVNLKPALQRTGDDQAFLLELDRTFARHNERLARAADLDLSRWE